MGECWFVLELGMCKVLFIFSDLVSWICMSWKILIFENKVIRFYKRDISIIFLKDNRIYYFIIFIKEKKKYKMFILIYW